MATLKWDGDELRLGNETRATVVRGTADRLYYYVINDVAAHRDGYERKEDAMQDCLNAVRELLKKAGA